MSNKYKALFEKLCSLANVIYDRQTRAKDIVDGILATVGKLSKNNPETNKRLKDISKTAVDLRNEWDNYTRLHGKQPDPNHIYIYSKGTNDIHNAATAKLKANSTLPRRPDENPGVSKKQTDCRNACFLAGTMVTMADGTLRPIESVEPGMDILQKAPRPTARTRCNTAKVLGVAKSASNQIATITTVSGRSITTTLTHPFYLPEQDRWGSVDGVMDPGSKVSGVALRVGDTLLTDSTARWLGKQQLYYDTIESINIWASHEDVLVYNLTVSAWQCYFAGGVLVHNMCERMGAAVAALSGAAAGLVVGYMAEDALVNAGVDDEVTIQIVSHAASAASGAVSGALVGTFICPVLGTAVGAAVGAFGGFLANGVRMIFYRATDDRGRYISHDGKPLYAGYLGSIKTFQPDPFWGPINDPAKVATSLILASGRLGTKVAMRAGERGAERAGERAAERAAERGMERGMERAVERGAERAAERGVERVAERGMERGMERIVERGTERLVERSAVSGALRTATSPWLLIADAVDVGVGAGMQAAGADEETAEVVAGGASFVTSVGIGAGVGAAAGGIGAVPGALVGAGSWAAGKVVDKATQASKGEEGHVKIKNTCGHSLRVYAYDRRDYLQVKSYQHLKLNPGEVCSIAATDGGFSFGAKCTEFYVKIKNLQTSVQTPAEPTWGYNVSPGSSYSFTGFQLCLQ